MNSELIRNLHNAMYFLNIEGHGMSADHVKEAIAALSAKQQCDCHLHHQQVCDICQGVTGKDAEPEPEPLPEVEEWLKKHKVHFANGPYIQSSSDSFVRLINRITAAHKAELEKYKALADAVDHELVVSLESTLDSYDSPKEAINRLLAWAEQVALDPAISRDAQALIEQGRREALQEIERLKGLLGKAADHIRDAGWYDIADRIASAAQVQTVSGGK